MADTAQAVTSKDVQAEPQQSCAASDSYARSVVWWLTQPWLNTIAVATPVLLAGGVLMLFAYLRGIHRGDLLPQAVATSSGLILVVIAALLLAVVWAITILASAIFIHLATECYPDVSAMPRRLPAALLVWIFAWWILIYVEALQSDEHFGMAVLGLLIVVTVFSVLMHTADWLQRDRLSRYLSCSVFRVTTFGKLIGQHRKAVLRRFGRACLVVLVGLLVGLVVWFALTIAAFAPLNILVVAPSLGDMKINGLTALMWVSASIPGPLIGWLYFHSIGQGQRIAEVRRKVALTTLFVTCISVFASFYPIGMQVLRVLGVYSTVETQFAISSPSLIPNFKAAHIDPVPVKVLPVTGLSAVEGNEAIAPTVRVFVRFRFGTQLMLCTTPYDPLRPPPPRSQWAEVRHGKVQWKQGHCLDLDVKDVRRIASN